MEPRTPTKRARLGKIEGLPTAAHTTEYQRGAILALNHVGYSLNEIADMVDCGRSSVSRILQSPVKNSPEHVRKTPTKILERREKVDELRQEHPHISANDISVALEDDGVEVSRRTIQRDLRELGYLHMVLVKVPELTDTQIEKRVEFCRMMLQYSETDPIWDQIIFSDETKKGAADMDHAAWQKPDEKRMERTFKKYGVKIHVWGYIGVKCRHLQLVDTHSATGDKYLEYIRDTIGKNSREWRRNHVWQQDNASVHNKGRRWLESNGFRVLD